MKKFWCVLAVFCLTLALIVGCSSDAPMTEIPPSIFDEEPVAPNTFTPDMDGRFFLVDSWDESADIGFPHLYCYVYADKYTGVMYLFTFYDNTIATSPLLNEDGTPMIYDGM